MSTITPHYRTVQQLLQSQKFAIDEFQREYKWEKKQVDELLDDLQGKFSPCCKPSDAPSAVAHYEEYYLGSIIVSKRDGKNYLIDGQQRVTSLTLLLIFLYREAEKRGLPDQIRQTLAPLIYSDNLGEMSFNLDLPERAALLDALFYAKEFNPDKADESVRNMLARYNDIEQSDLSTELGDGLQNFIYWLLTKVGLIEIAATNDSDANEIFETMNDRGKPLSPIDMLKAFLLAPINDPAHRNKANETWRQQVLGLASSDQLSEDSRDQGQEAACIKAWLRAQYAESIRDRKADAKDRDWELIGTSFHRWARDNKIRLELGNGAAHYAFMTKNFPFFAEAYLLIQNASEKYTTGLEHIFYNAHNGFTWQSTALLASLSITDKEDVVRKKIEVTAAYLDIWIMRRVVNFTRIGYSTVSYAMYLLCKEIRKKPLGSLVKVLVKRLESDNITFDGAPDKGRKGLDDFFLNQWSRRYVLHMLARLTAYSEVLAGRSDQFDIYVKRNVKNPFDIEHIWSKDYDSYSKEFETEDEFEEWRDNIASLLLLPADINRSLQDRTYSQKIKKYSSENMYAASLSETAYLNQPKFRAAVKKHDLPFNHYYAFGQDEQTERRQLVRKLSSLIWAPERLQEIADS
jgi:uncharacterized protein with ParB-like and HNH nuclease domain